jgi:signal transduction histidine kinase
MRERAEAVGGSLHVTSRRDAGTTVRMVWDDQPG